MSGAIVMAFIIGPDQQAVGHVADKLTADITAGTDTYTLMFNFEIGFIPDVTEAQCASIQCVFIGCCGRSNHRTIKLSVFADRDIKTTFAHKDASLFLHTIIIAMQLIAAHAQVDRPPATNDRDTDTPADTGLFRIIVIAVLLTLQQQVTVHIRLDSFATDLRTLQHAATGDVKLVTGVDCGFRVSHAVAAFAAFALVQTGGDINAPAALTGTYSYPQ
ncbi:Uncharacterised protein [Yersinia enterocolitica]|nr:Uncharacterised protein [Yersinia enterocolitica]